MKKNNIPAIISIVLLATVVCFYFLDGEFKNWSNDAYDVFTTGKISKIQDFLKPYRDIGYLILLGAFLFQLFLIFVPSVLVMSLCIVMYGPVLGSVLCLVGVFLASVFAFVMGEFLGNYTIDRIIGKRSRKHMTHFLQRYGFWTVTVFRISPFLSNDAVSFAAGLVRMNFWRFMAATMLGITPLTLLLAWIGEDTDRMRLGFIILGVISIAALIVYIFLDKKEESFRSQAAAILREKS